MSTELAISAVSLVLRDLMTSGVKLDDGLVPLSITKGLEHTILPPDRVRIKHHHANVINVFLYRVHTNAAYRNHEFSGQTPLALNLEYLITAFGEDDRDEVAHFILGKAMRMLQDHAVIARSDLRLALKAARVHDQLENLRIVHQDLTLEDLSKLWTAFQTHYRISASYLITVLLIDSKIPVRAPLPVLKRGADDSGWDALAGAPPELDRATPATGFNAVRLGEELILSGENLDTSGLTAIVRHPLVAPKILDVVAIDSGHIKVKIDPDTKPGTAAAWVAGLYSIALQVSRPSLPAWLTNEVPFALAPAIVVTPNLQSGPNALFDLTIDAKPQIRDQQPAIVVFGDQQIAAGTIPPPANVDAPSIVKVKVQGPLGTYRVRLRVDGVDSIPIKQDGSTYKFDDDQSVEVQP
ncbi:MAG: DUF4255 domain-containing protein [Thermoanaerobaculia bacterium]